MTDRRAIVIDAALAERLMPDDGRCALVVPRGHGRPRPWRRRQWRPVDPDAAVGVLKAAPPSAVVLVRRRDADPGAAVLRPLARLVGLAVLLLPEPADAATWTTVLACRWAGAGQPRLTEAVSVAAGLTVPGGPLPRAPWGGAELPLPALRPSVIGRWAAFAWRPCEVCREGGGLPGARCPACDARLPAGAGPRRGSRPAGRRRPPLRTLPAVS